MRSGEVGLAVWEVEVADVATGAVVADMVVPVVGGWSPAGLDVARGQVLLNRGWEQLFPEPALLVDIGEPDATPQELPIAGRARFVTRPVDIAAPVSVAGTDAGAPGGRS